MSQFALTWATRAFVAVLLAQAVGLVWAAYLLFDEITRKVFSDHPPDIPGVGGTVAAYGTFFGVLTILVAGMWLAAKKLIIWRASGKHED